MSKHTPGPWIAARYDGYGPRTTIRQGCERTGMRIASTFETTSPQNIERNEANARLIAAAPAMLEALEEMLEVHGVRWEHVRGDSSIPASWVELSDKARAAIKAAKGEA